MHRLLLTYGRCTLGIRPPDALRRRRPYRQYLAILSRLGPCGVPCHRRTLPLSCPRPGNTTRNSVNLQHQTPILKRNMDTVSLGEVHGPTRRYPGGDLSFYLNSRHFCHGLFLIKSPVKHVCPHTFLSLPGRLGFVSVVPVNGLAKAIHDIDA